ncbi:anthrax toxin-like adenylyl cyclase domain-containing protein (plasmid) [Pantoea sp. BJ2]|uniref:Anthrax toxin-like adenylyl cyclase domain-containing protein n=1 Tax=Pantoea sp. BJ2 TaxID=3141322 RepID=A0AAU7U4B8_9GAMM
MISKIHSNLPEWVSKSESRILTRIKIPVIKTTNTFYTAEPVMKKENYSLGQVRQKPFDITLCTSRLERNNTIEPSASNWDKFTLTTKDVILFGEAISSSAINQNVIIGIRDPNKHGFFYLENGNPAKNFLTKVKTSDSGPTAGLLAVKAEYSKVAAEKMGVQHHYIQEAINAGATAIDLVLTKDRINTLEKEGLIKFSETNDLATKHISKLTESNFRILTARYPSGERSFLIDQSGKVHDTEMQPVKVLTNVPAGNGSKNQHLPATTDYDLFSIMPPINRSDNYRRVSVPPRATSDKFNLNFLKSKSLYGEEEDPLKGNTSFFLEKSIDKVNKEIFKAGHVGGDIILHSNETANPHSPGYVPGEKVYFFLPDGYVLCIETKEKMIEFYSEVEKQGYKPEYSPRFGF